MAASYRVVGGPTSFSDDTEHGVTLTDAVVAGETAVLLVGCSVTDITGIVGYADSEAGAMVAGPYCSTQLSWQFDEEFGGAGGGGYNGVSCFSSYCPDGIASGTNVRFGVKWSGSAFYHGQSPYAVVIALNSGTGGQYMIYDTSDSSSTGADSTPHTPSITSAANAIILGFFAGAASGSAGWMTPDGGWGEFCDTAPGTESSFNIAGMGRVETSPFTGTAGGTTPSTNFGTIIVSYKATSAEPTRGRIMLAGTRETGSGTDFFSNGNTAAFPFVAAANGTSARMGARFQGDNAGITTVKLGIYTHDSGNNRPGTLLGSGSVSINPVNRVPFGATVSGVTLASGTTYWLAFSGAGEQVDIGGVSSAAFGREGAGNMVGTWSPSGNMGVKPGIWIEDAGLTFQELHPDADTAAGSWASTPLWSKIDEDTGSPDGTVISDTAV